MNNYLYDMIFKRKSFHLFRNTGDEHITDDELKDIENEFNKFRPLVEDINVKMKIVKDSTTCKRGQEYCILLYSEKKDNYLQNIGYIGEQLDLYLVSKNIGTLWFGIGKVEEQQIDGLDFVIMIAIAKIDSETKFRKSNLGYELETFFENLDPYIILRLLAENESCKELDVYWSFFDVVEGGWASREEIISPLSDNQKILIVIKAFKHLYNF